MKKIAPPGRKASIKREAFKVDEDVKVEEIPVSSLPGAATAQQDNSAAEEAERQQAAAEEAERQARLEARRRRQQEQEEEEARQQMEAEKERARQQRAAEREAAAAAAAAAEEEEQRQEALRRRREERERARQQAEAEAEAQRAAEEAAAEEERRQEALRIRRAERERARQQAEAEAEAQRAAEEAAAEEERRQEALRRRREERERARQQAEAEAEAQRAAEEAAAEEERRQEALRIRREERERARRQAEEEAEAQRAAEEAAAEEERRRRRREEKERARREAEEEEERQRAAEEAERQRLEAEQAELVRKQEQELEEMRRQARERAAARKREEEAEAAEIARQAEAERQQALREAQAAAMASQQKEDAELEQKRRRAEEQRRKRQMFLSDMNSFSDQFESQTQVKEEQLSKANRKHEELLTTVATKELKVESGRPLVSEPIVLDPKPVVIIDTSPIAPAPVAAREDVPSRRIVEGTSGKRREEIDSLTNSLFRSTSLKEEESYQSAPVVATSSTAFNSKGNLDEIEEAPTFSKSDIMDDLRVPTRIGGVKSKSEKAAASSATAAASSIPAPAPAPVPVKAVAPPAPAAPEPRFYPQDEPMLKPVAPPIVPPTRGVVIVEEDEEEEGTGALESISNILTKEERRTMTHDQKASWKAKQNDLHTRRKDFHGAVTYMFDGVFSWQMYGSAEALDEYGNTYTEYLMRCQWGTNFENMQPWIVAHRYREFDFLDQQFKKQFPHMEKNMPKLPKKEIFRSMDSSVVSKRRQTIEDYMSRIVESMPTLLRSDTMNNFLRIKERITAIKNLLRLQESVALEVTAVESAGITGITEDSTPTASASSGGEPARRKSVKVQETPAEDDTMLLWSVDEAEKVKEELNARPLDEDSMGFMEEDIKKFGFLLRTKPAKEIVDPNGEVTRVLKAISKRWPRLRATAVVDVGVDFALIPRAMQAEEDLMVYINQFRSLLALREIRR